MKDKSKVLKTYGYMFDKLQYESLYEIFQNALNRHFTYVYFTIGVFCFHVSFSYFNLLIINAFKS